MIEEIEEGEWIDKNEGNLSLFFTTANGQKIQKQQLHRNSCLSFIMGQENPLTWKT